MTNLPASAKPTADADPVSADGRLVSEATYWEDWYDTGGISYEWNNGRLEEQPVSDFETFQVYLWFLELLRHFLRQQPIGQVVALEMGFRLSLASGTVIRKPDLAVVLNDNPVPLDLRDSSYHGVFDLCVEALSTEKPAHIHRDLVVKKAEYAAGGVPEYHVLHREHGNLAFYGLTPGGVYAPLPAAGHGDDRVVRSRVLPGFQFRVNDLIRRPGPDTMRRDPVYSDFVLPEWTRAERAREQAERERDSVLGERDAATRQRDEATRQRDAATRERDAVSRARDLAIAEARREAAARAEAEAELARLRANLSKPNDND
ncbi:Uma2 family endonuclease [uncultured Thiohalocapsa sp.]|uniref:Uma2 family endonuclease n=1 Tax=uncultured Thiohalocapsa sp. TaxID=768990 RepID=UPI0025FF954B|nr:Uma2 family endonuclease [uncultured Thiohalocapsa sp.]